jgi:hypothetical protein
MSGEKWICVESNNRRCEVKGCNHHREHSHTRGCWMNKGCQSEACDHRDLTTHCVELKAENGN